MTSLAIEYVYQYPFASEVRTHESQALVRLSSSEAIGGPYFFESSVAAPAIFAEALLCVGGIIRAHFFERRPGLLDPVVTCGQSRLRFEGFSGCCGVYVQCAFHDSAFANPIQGRGTTNIDFNEQLIHGLAQARFSTSAQLAVGSSELTLGVNEASYTEKKVKLPLRWLKGFCEIQKYLTSAEHKFALPAVEFLKLIRSLPRSAAKTQTLWATPSGNSVRLASKPSTSSVPVIGTERWRALEPLVRLARQSVHAWYANGVTTWQIDLPGCTFLASFSPEIYRGFSGEGQTLQSLSGIDWRSALDQVRATLQWQGAIDPDALAARLNLPVAEIRSALDALASRGLVGFDVSSNAYFHRELPFQTDLVENLQPRLLDARKLVASGTVRLHQQISELESEWLVPGSDIEHLIRLSESGDRCTCTWYSKYQNGRGPCKHILAARIGAFGDDF